MSYLCFPAQVVGGFTLSDRLDKRWSQVPPDPPLSTIKIPAKSPVLRRTSLRPHRTLTPCRATISVYLPYSKIPKATQQSSTRVECSKVLLTVDHSTGIPPKRHYHVNRLCMINSSPTDCQNYSLRDLTFLSFHLYFIRGRLYPRWPSRQAKVRFRE